VHARYRELARKYHPDLYKGGDAKFKSINEAYHAIIQGTAAMHMTTVAHTTDYWQQCQPPPKNYNPYHHHGPKTPQSAWIVCTMIGLVLCGAILWVWQSASDRRKSVRYSLKGKSSLQMSSREQIDSRYFEYERTQCNKLVADGEDDEMDPLDPNRQSSYALFRGGSFVDATSSPGAAPGKYASAKEWEMYLDRQAKAKVWWEQQTKRFPRSALKAVPVVDNSMDKGAESPAVHGMRAMSTAAV